MIALGAGSPMEAWDPALKSNTTFSHPWAASPAYLVYRGTFGIQALEPGYKRFEVRPQPGGLTRAEAVVPTVRGQIPAAFATADAGKLDMVVGVPANTSAHVAVPKPTDGSTTLYVDRVAQEGTVDGNFLTVDVGSGCHIVSTTGAASLPANVLQVAKGCDTMPPAITVPADITAEATGPNGAVVSFTSATATDIVDGNVAVSCDHAGGEHGHCQLQGHRRL